MLCFQQPFSCRSPFRIRDRRAIRRGISLILKKIGFIGVCTGTLSECLIYISTAKIYRRVVNSSLYSLSNFLFTLSRLHTAESISACGLGLFDVGKCSDPRSAKKRTSTCIYSKKENSYCQERIVHSTRNLSGQSFRPLEILFRSLNRFFSYITVGVVRRSESFHYQVIIRVSLCVQK